MKTNVKKLSAVVSSVILSGLVSSAAQASGFALIENSASGMGNAFAGAAAIAEDASTIYFNPAGMTRLQGRQMSAAIHLISPSSDFSNDGSTSLTTAPLSGPDADGGQSAMVANFYYVDQLNSDWTFGLGINAPFGLGTDYGEDWVGRYHATKSDMLTININPALAIRANKNLSIGIGFNLQYIEATLENHLDSAAICQGGIAPLIDFATSTPGAGVAACNGAGLSGAGIGDATLDSTQSLKGDDWSWGVNFGMLYDFDDKTRMGVSYRSGVNHELAGDVDFTVNANLQAVIDGLGSYSGLFSDSAVSAHVELPDTLSISLVHEMDPKLTLLGDLTWTGWEKFNELRIKFANPVQSDSIIPEDWNNSWRLAVGANYKADAQWTYRAGLALDQTPIASAEERTPRIPGNDRKWLSLGVGYQMSSEMSIDVGYSHLFVSNTNIDNEDPSFGHTLTGSYDLAVDVLSAQVNMKF
ncbi:MAG: outer membrane protein transport protein [Gammaproteobacteria bacterium]|nr:outer membrane protein transport protein [Gammaproteobacteria bacterium]